MNCARFYKCLLNLLFNFQVIFNFSQVAFMNSVHRMFLTVRETQFNSNAFLDAVLSYNVYFHTFWTLKVDFYHLDV